MALFPRRAARCLTSHSRRSCVGRSGRHGGNLTGGLIDFAYVRVFGFLQPAAFSFNLSTWANDHDGSDAGCRSANAQDRRTTGERDVT
jgi:hypothetical protein